MKFNRMRNRTSKKTPTREHKTLVLLVSRGLEALIHQRTKVQADRYPRLAQTQIVEKLLIIKRRDRF